MSADSESPAGAGAFLRAWLVEVLAFLATRGELASIELAEARDRAVCWLALGVVAAVLLLAALTTMSLWVAVLFWEGPRALAVGVLGLAYLLGAAALLIVIRRQMAAAPALLAQTREELRKDREALGTGLRGANDGAG